MGNRDPSGNRVRRMLGLRPGELGPVAILFGWCFCAVAAYFVGRSVRDALFLANLSPSRLPAMYITSPLTVTAVGLGYVRIADRIRRDKLVVTGALVLAAITAGAYFALGTGNRVYYALYVYVNVMGAIAVMQFWTVAGDRFNAREAKGLFAVIAVGGTAANTSRSASR